MSQDWIFDNRGGGTATYPINKPTPKRFRKVIRREEELRDQLHPPPPEQEPAAPESGRDASGRFTKGNKCGTGNPFARQIAGFRKALCGALTDEDFAAMAQVLKAKALAGDLAAMKLLFTYVLGRPPESPNPDRLEIEDFQLLKERLSPLKDDWRLVKTIVPVEGIVGAGHHVADLRAQNWKDMIQQEEEEVSEPSETGEPGNTLDAATSTRTQGLVGSLLAILQEEAARADAALKAAREAGLTVPPANGGNGAGMPPANGDGGQGAPSRNGDHGERGGVSPPRTPPPANGDGGGRSRVSAPTLPPSRNGSNGELPLGEWRT